MCKYITRDLTVIDSSISRIKNICDTYVHIEREDMYMVLDFGKINIFIKFVILTFYISINDLGD